MKSIIIIPTYNEVENIANIIPRVFETVPEIDILVVDDSSPDGTAEKVKEMQEKWGDSLYLLIRETKDGLAGAYLTGFKECLDKDYDIIIEMDADGSHDPKYLPIMLEEAKSNDYVIASRYVKGGGVENWSPLRKFISIGGSWYSRFLLNSPIKDMTGGFNLWNKKVLETMGLENIISQGYLFQVELKVRAYKLGFKYTETPIIFKDRELGVSKMSGRIFIEALLKIWKLRLNLK